MTTIDEISNQVIACRRCARLVAWREEVARKKRRAYQDWTYWGKAVPGFGDPYARLLIVGLAPGAHGANRTGRVFTGDDSGKFLFRALHRAGLANQPTSEHAQDGLALIDTFITAVCHCVPPDNKPSSEELAACRPFFEAYLKNLPNVLGVVVLGKIAMDSLLGQYRAMGHPLPAVDFTHAGFQDLGPELPWLITSYHPSRQNTQTGRLTEAMFDQVWSAARKLLDEGARPPASA